MTPEIVSIPFHGDDVLAVEIDGRPHVVLKPAMDTLGLDYPSQYAKLRTRSWATVGQTAMVAADGRTRQMITVDIRTFLMLLATVDERRVAEDVRGKLVLYQAEVADVIEAYWTTGVAVAPTQRNPVDDLDLAQLMINQIRESREAAKRAEQLAVESAQTSLNTSARLDAIEGRHDWYAALGYAKLHGLPTSTTYLQRLGAEAGRVGREHNVEANRVQHALYGAVNQWPEWVWDEAIERRRAQL